MSEPKSRSGELEIDFHELDSGWGEGFDENEPTAKHIPSASGFFGVGAKTYDALSRLDEEEATLVVDYEEYLSLLHTPFLEIALAVRARYKAFVAKAFADMYDPNEREAIYEDVRLVRDQLRKIKKAV